jgi:hypothetical protein
MKLHVPRILVAAAAACLLAGCALGGTGSDPFSEGTRGEQEIKVFITNLAFMDATVHSVTNGSRRRLGRVTGKRESVFTVPFRHSAEFYLEIDIMAGPKCRTEMMFVDPGDHVELVIQTDNPYLLCGES